MRRDLLVAAACLAAAVAVLGRLWADLDHRYLVDGMQDQYQWEWFFAVTARNLTGHHDPLFTTLQNHPLGVNLMANTVMLGVGVPLAAVTVVFGPTATWAVALTGGLAGTAFAWYWTFAHRLGRSRGAAALGGAFCGFAPPVVSHANAHPNFVALFVVPFLVLGVLRLRHSRRTVRDGALLGVLAAFQVFLGEEVLLLTGVGLGAFLVGYMVLAPAVARVHARRMVAGVAVGGLVCLVLVAYPLWWQLTGPQSFHGLRHGPTGNDLLAFTAFSRRSLAGDPVTAAHLALNPTEENAFFGLPLVVVTVAAAVLVRQVATLRAVAAAAVVVMVLSLGSDVTVGGVRTGIPGPWLPFSRLPFLESVVESRLTLACVPMIATLLAYATDQMRRRRVGRIVWCGALVAALLPVAPTPLPAVDRAPTPAFFTDGSWRAYVRPGRAVVTVPLPDPADARALQWQVGAGLGFPLAEGYFVGPTGPDRAGTYGAVRRPTSKLLARVAASGTTPMVSDADRQVARSDLAYWRADVVVLGPHPQEDTLRTTVDALLGPGRYVDGVWVWDVRHVGG